MSSTVAIINLIIGAVYTSYGVMTVADLRRNWSTLGPSHFGFAWIAMAFTCGPHHLEHGLHILTTDRSGGPLDLAAVVVGLPAGVLWFLLRLEAQIGGRGDRTVSGTPRWLESVPSIFAVYVVAITTGAVATLTRSSTFDNRLLANVALVVLYNAIAYVLLRTQLQNHESLGTWSVSGLSLTLIFTTCAAMHAVWAVYGATGRYLIDAHLFAIDVVAVPAAVYFLWVVGSLNRGTLSDWTADVDTAPQRADDELEAMMS